MRENELDVHDYVHVIVEAATVQTDKEDTPRSLFVHNGKTSQERNSPFNTLAKAPPLKIFRSIKDIHHRSQMTQADP